MSENTNTTGLNMQAFDFEEAPVRVMMREGGEPWFVAADVARVLGIQNIRQNVARLDADEKDGVSLTYSSSNGVQQARNTTIINESGLYTLILRCDDAIKAGTTAYRFRKWVTSEVLPALRKTGSYEVAEPEALPLTPMQEVRDLLLTSARAVRDKTLDVGRAQQIANLSARYLEAIKLEGDAIGYEAVLGLQGGQARGRVLRQREARAELLQVLPQPQVPPAEAGEPGLPGEAVSGQEAVGGTQPGTGEDAQPQGTGKGDIQ